MGAPTIAEQSTGGYPSASSSFQKWIANRVDTRLDTLGQWSGRLLGFTFRLAILSWSRFGKTFNEHPAVTVPDLRPS